MENNQNTQEQSPQVAQAQESVASTEANKVAVESTPIFKKGFFARIGLWFLNTAIVASIGAFAGYYAAMLTPVPVQFMVFDLDKAMNVAAKAASEKGLDPRAVADEVVQKAKMKIRQVAESGVVVLDRGSVIDAPAGSLITIDESEISFNKQPMPTKPDFSNGPVSSQTQEQLQAQLKAVNDQLKAIQQQAMQQQNAGNQR